MCPIVFRGHQSHLKVTWAKRTTTLTRIMRSRTVTPVWLHRRLRNNAHSSKGHRRGGSIFSVISQISRSSGPKSGWFASDLSIDDYKSNSRMAIKWHTWFLWIWEMFSIVSRWHLSNVNVTRVEKPTISCIWIRFEQDYRAGSAFKSPRFALLYKQVR